MSLVDFSSKFEKQTHANTHIRKLWGTHLHDLCQNRNIDRWRQTMKMTMPFLKMDCSIGRTQSHASFWIWQNVLIDWHWRKKKWIRKIERAHRTIHSILSNRTYFVFIVLHLKKKWIELLIYNSISCFCDIPGLVTHNLTCIINFLYWHYFCFHILAVIHPTLDLSVVSRQ